MRCIVALRHNPWFLCEKGRNYAICIEWQVNPHFLLSNNHRQNDQWALFNNLLIDEMTKLALRRPPSCLTANPQMGNKKEKKKKQLPEKLKDKIAKLTSMPAEDGSSTLGVAVSYTHLDVYKRQSIRVVRPCFC